MRPSRALIPLFLLLSSLSLPSHAGAPAPGYIAINSP